MLRFLSLPAIAICLLSGIRPLRTIADEPAPKRTEGRHAELKKHAIASTPKLRELGFDLLSYPRMSGSTSTQPLAALIACRCFGLDYEWVGRKQRLPPWDPRAPQVEAESKLLEFTLQG